MSILAILAISTIGSVAAYTPSYTISNDGKNLNINFNAGDNPPTGITTVNLGEDKKVNIEIKFLLGKRVINITTVNTPNIDKTYGPYFQGISQYGLPYTESPTNIVGSIRVDNNYVTYFAHHNTMPRSVTIKFTDSLIKHDVTTPGKNNLPDLKVTKVTKKGNYHYITVTNIGKKSATKNHLGVYVGKKKIKTLNIKSLDSGKSTTIKVLLPKKHRGVIKTFKADINNIIKEINKKNNVLKAR